MITSYERMYAICNVGNNIPAVHSKRGNAFYVLREKQLVY